MDEATTPTAGTSAVCPWCSAAITAEAATCASCGAILIAEETSELPGVTEIDPKVARGERPPPPRSRLLSWISGDYPETTGGPVDPGALAPPDPEVRVEILRLELQAEVANLQAEADAMRADAIVEGQVAEAAEIAAAESEMEEAVPGAAPHVAAPPEPTDASAEDAPPA